MWCHVVMRHMSRKRCRRRSKLPSTRALVKYALRAGLFAAVQAFPNQTGGEGIRTAEALMHPHKPTVKLYKAITRILKRRK